MSLARAMPKDAIGILIDLARRGEIDPWDIDVVQLTDRFLHSLGRLDPADLPRFGQAIFYASVLVHMKAEVLEGRLDAQAEPPIEPEEPAEESDAPDALLRVPLERVLRRRPAVPAMEDRPLTLNDLIAHLREIETNERRTGRERAVERRTRLKGVSVQTMEEVAELAHHENLEAVIEELAALIERFAAPGEAVPFERLLQHYRDRVGAFLGLLFLAHRSRVSLAQTEFYRDIAVTREEVVAHATQPEDAPGSGALP